MNITSSPFLYLFLPACIAVYYILPAKKSLTLRNLLLTAASIAFYAWGELVGVFLLIALIAANWLLGLWAGRQKRTKTGKTVVLIAVLLNAGVLVFYKYLDWMLGGLYSLGGKSWAGLGLTLPLGLSFFCFQAISYVVDIYRGKAAALKNPLDTALYLSLFFKITSGPIMAYHQFEKQLRERTTSLEQFSDGMWRFIFGLGKKVLIASTLSVPYAEIFGADPSTLPVTEAWLGCLIYLIYIYFDFSGYSDMALGLGKMFGFELPENFNYPYLATSVSEYWTRWHITLGAWFRDYMFYPLTLGPVTRLKKKLVVGKGMDKKKFAYLQNAIVLGCIWFTTGLWHGAKIGYILWGLINGAVAYIEVFCKPAGVHPKRERALGWLYTFAVAFFTKPLICCATIGDAIRYYGAMFALNGNAFSAAHVGLIVREYRFAMIIGILGCAPLCRMFAQKVESLDRKWLTTVLHAAEVIVAIAVLLLSVAYVQKNGSVAFLYQKF